MHNAEHPSNYFFQLFTHYQAEQMKKEIICVQILLEIHQTEHSRFLRLNNFIYTPVLVRVV